MQADRGFPAAPTPLSPQPGAGIYMLIRESFLAYRGRAREVSPICSPEDCAAFFHNNSNLLCERVVCLVLNAANCPITWFEVSSGTVSKSLIEPSAVFAIPLRERASSIILVHNHPSGNLVVSEQDVEVTRIIIRLGSMHSILLLDHIIIVHKGCLSVRSEHPELWEGKGEYRY